MTTPWRTCEYCGKVVKINKPIFGSLHLCVTDEEKAYIDMVRSRRGGWPDPPAPYAPPATERRP